MSSLEASRKIQVGCKFIPFAEEVPPSVQASLLPGDVITKVGKASVGNVNDFANNLKNNPR